MSQILDDANNSKYFLLIQEIKKLNEFGFLYSIIKNGSRNYVIRLKLAIYIDNEELSKLVNLGYSYYDRFFEKDLEL